MGKQINLIDMIKECEDEQEINYKAGETTEVKDTE